MKKILLLFIAAWFSFACVNAQNVYKEIKNMAQKSIEDAGTNDMIKQINQFKLDALDYLLLKMREQMPDSTINFLDKEAYAMNNFVNFYTQNILECKDKPQALQVNIIKLFMDASYSNPLFNDNDIELTLCYFSNASCLTRFSLDTDWRKAVAAIMLGSLDELKATYSK